MSDTVDHLRHIARDPIGHHGLYNRTPEALQTFEARNGSDIADEYAAVWRRALAFGAPLVGLALLAVLLIVTAVRAEGKLGADLRWYHKLEEMK